VGLLARGTTPQARTTGSVYNSSTGQPVTWISQVGIFPGCEASWFHSCASFWQQPLSHLELSRHQGEPSYPW